MTSKTHNVIAFATLLTISKYYLQTNLSAVTIIGSLVANIIGSLMPDVDQESNRLWDLLPGGDLLGRFFKKLFLGHRSLSHSLIGLFLVYKATFWLIPKLFNSNFIDPKILIWSLLIGYVSHLIADLLTEEGLPLLFPIKWKFGIPPIKALRIRSGHWVENWVIFPGVMIYAVITVILYIKSLL